MAAITKVSPEYYMDMIKNGSYELDILTDQIRERLDGSQPRLSHYINTLARAISAKEAYYQSGFFGRVCQFFSRLSSPIARARELMLTLLIRESLTTPVLTTTTMLPEMVGDPKQEKYNDDTEELELKAKFVIPSTATNRYILEDGNIEKVFEQGKNLAKDSSDDQLTKTIVQNLQLAVQARKLYIHRTRPSHLQQQEIDAVDNRWSVVRSEIMDAAR